MPKKTNLLIPADRRNPEWIEQYKMNRWFNLGDTSRIETDNVFRHMSPYDIENPHVFMLDIMRKPANFFFTCKHLLGITAAPFQLVILHELWVRTFPMLIGSRGMGKSFILALYAVLKAFFHQGSKIVVCGAGFRQAKVIFEYCEKIWLGAPVLRSFFDSKSGPRRNIDRCELRIGESIILFLPLGDGSKIRGQRATVVIGDEFASIPVDIFETVVRGFAAVSMDPVGKMQREYQILAMRELGLWSDDDEEAHRDSSNSNQTILSGTAYYQFNHFYDYFRRYKAIIESGGDHKKLADIFDGEVPEHFDHRDYGIMRIPAKSLPVGFMDMKMIAQAKATVHKHIYLMEYGACFCGDSNGFFSRKLIESCVAGNARNPILLADVQGPVDFAARMRGDVNCRYVMGVDPASERDNLAIVILEVWPNHRRIVHCWTVNRKKYKERLKVGLAKEHNYYGFCARRVLDLHRAFRCERIGIDSQGGGRELMEALADPNILQPNEQPLYEVIDPDKPKDSDGFEGQHILMPISFADAKWISDANHGMKFDFEQHRLLFPQYDAIEVAVVLEEASQAAKRQKLKGILATVAYDTLEDVMFDIEELKDELATINHTQTGIAMRDHFDTPETKGEGGKKGRMRKDRYSGLLICNKIARELDSAPDVPRYAGGGAASSLANNKSHLDSKPYTSAPQWWANGLPNSRNFGRAVRRN